MAGGEWQSRLFDVVVDGEMCFGIGYSRKDRAMKVEVRICLYSNVQVTVTSCRQLGVMTCSLLLFLSLCS